MELISVNEEDPDGFLRLQGVKAESREDLSTWVKSKKTKVKNNLKKGYLKQKKFYDSNI